jgi:hypothetical protein
MMELPRFIKTVSVPGMRIKVPLPILDPGGPIVGASLSGDRHVAEVGFGSGPSDPEVSPAGILGVDPARHALSCKAGLADGFPTDSGRFRTRFDPISGQFRPFPGGWGGDFGRLCHAKSDRKTVAKSGRPRQIVLSGQFGSDTIEAACPIGGRALRVRHPGRRASHWV